MNNKFSKIGIVIAALGIGIFLVAQHYWRSYDGVNLVIAPYYAWLLSLFSEQVISEPAFTSQGFSLTEDLSIYITAGIAFILGLSAIALSFVSMYKNEIASYTIAPFLLGNSVFILYSLKIALFILIVLGAYWIYLKSRLTNASKRRDKNTITLVSVI